MNKPIFVIVLSPLCGHCHMYVPEWEQEIKGQIEDDNKVDIIEVDLVKSKGSNDGQKIPKIFKDNKYQKPVPQEFLEHWVQWTPSFFIFDADSWKKAFKNEPKEFKNKKGLKEFKNKNSDSRTKSSKNESDKEREVLYGSIFDGKFQNGIPIPSQRFHPNAENLLQWIDETVSNLQK